MGGCFSCRSSYTLNNIRVVHLNGYVEDFEHPVLVSQVITGKPSKHFVCTPAQLLSHGSRPLKPDVQLQPGHIYLLLPYSTLQADVSPVDLASVARKLTAIAKSRRSKAKSPTSTSPLSSQHGSTSPMWNSPARSPNRVSDAGTGGMAYGVQRAYGSRSWKPILDTIREKSFTRRSESDLQEMHSQTLK